MQIKMLTLMAGPDGVRKPGQIYDLPDKESEALIAGGYAETATAKSSLPRAAVRGRGRTAARQEAALDASQETQATYGA